MVSGFRRSSWDSSPEGACTGSPVRGISDAAIRRLVLSRPIPDKLIRDIARLPEHDEPFSRRYSGSRLTVTPRLRYTLRLVALGWTNRRIADELGATEEGVRDRVKRLLSIYHARNRTELVAKAIRAGDV